MICSSLFPVHQCTTLLMIIFYAAAKTVTELENTLQSESKVIINWFKNNKMIVDPEKLQEIILEKQKHDYSNQAINFDIKIVQTESSIRILSIQLDDKLNFSLDVSNICKSTENQLSALIRWNNFSCFEGKRLSIDSYFMSNFNYCPLVWIFSKIENLQKRALIFLYNNYQLSYEVLLDKAQQ